MALRLHNTLTGQEEAFRPLEAGKVSFYSCGPTVYDFAHIGNFRSFLLGDTLRRWLESPLCARVDPEGNETGSYGYEVTHVMNITDVGHMTDDSVADGGGEDKMEAAAQRLKEAKKAGTLPAGVDNVNPGDPYAIAGFYAGAFVEDAKRLGLKVPFDADEDPTVLPRATGHVRAMLEIVVGLLEKGCAYRAGGAVYFDTQAFPDYGALSGNTLEKIREGAGGRVSATQQSEKRHPADFLLWKADASHLMKWDPSELLGRDVELGEGYPGWHIECSAMALERLAPKGSEHEGMIDIHSGGEDNIFPHHECEIAQSRCYTGKDRFARYWVHGRHLMVEGAKMSKSAGNFYTLRDLLGKGFDPAAIRLELIKTHYRKNANFTEQGLRDSTRMIERWRQDFQEILRRYDAFNNRNLTRIVSAYLRNDVQLSMDNDLNVAGVIASLNRFTNSFKNKPFDKSKVFDDATVAKLWDSADSRFSRFVSVFTDSLRVIGLERILDSQSITQTDDDLASQVEVLIERRAAARAAKDWAAADAVRDELAAMGVEIKDGPEGTTWTRKASL